MRVARALFPIRAALVKECGMPYALGFWQVWRDLPGPSYIEIGERWRLEASWAPPISDEDLDRFWTEFLEPTVCPNAQYVKLTNDNWIFEQEAPERAGTVGGLERAWEDLLAKYFPTIESVGVDIKGVAAKPAVVAGLVGLGAIALGVVVYKVKFG